MSVKKIFKVAGIAGLAVGALAVGALVVNKESAGAVTEGFKTAKKTVKKVFKEEDENSTVADAEFTEEAVTEPEEEEAVLTEKETDA